MSVKKRLCELHRLANNRNGSVSSACKKTSEANNKVYDLKQRIVAALDRLAEVYETFRGHVGHRGKGSPLQATCCSLQRKTWRHGSACTEFSDYRALRGAAWFDVKEAGRRHSELKRKAEEAHTRTFLQRESIRRATSDHVKSAPNTDQGVEHPEQVSLVCPETRT